MSGISVANQPVSSTPAAAAASAPPAAPQPQRPARKGWLAGTFAGCVMGGITGFGIYTLAPGTEPMIWQHLTWLNVSLVAAGASTGWATGKMLRGHPLPSRAMSMALAILCMHAAYTFTHDRAEPVLKEPVQKADTAAPVIPQQSPAKPEPKVEAKQQEQQAPVPAPVPAPEAATPAPAPVVPAPEITPAPTPVPAPETEVTPPQAPEQRFEPIDGFKGPDYKEQKPEVVTPPVTVVPAPAPAPVVTPPAPAPVVTREQQIADAVKAIQHSRMTPKLSGVMKRIERCEIEGRRNARICNQALKDLSFAAEYGRWGVTKDVVAAHKLLSLAYEKSAAEGNRNRQILHDMGDHALRGIGRDVNKAEACDYLQQSGNRLSRGMMKAACG